MPRGRRSAPQHHRQQRCSAEDGGGFDGCIEEEQRHRYTPAFRAPSIRRASRSSSASDRRADLSSSNAEIACSADPSKNVVSTCCSADFLTLSRATVGTYT